MATSTPKVLDNLLQDRVGLPHVLVLVVHLVNLLVWMGKVNHSQTFLLLALPCDYCVSPSPNNWIFGFFRLGLNLGVRIWGLLGQDLGTLTCA